MRYLNKAKLWSQLNKAYPNSSGGWFYNCLEDAFGCKSLTAPPKAKTQTLITKTLTVPDTLGDLYPLIVFPDGYAAGWRNVNTNRRRSPVEVPSREELSSLLTDGMFFRDQDGYIDNYHVTNPNLDWFVVFCHHGDWHFFSCEKTIKKIKQSWA